MDKYRVFFVYKKLTDEQKTVIINFWKKNNALPNEQVAQQRVEEVSTLTLNEKSELIGISTVYSQDFTAPNNPYFFLRVFIQKINRDSYNLRTRISQMNFSNLKKLYASQAHGIVIELENTKLKKLGESSQYFQKRGYRYYGKSPRGLQLWYVRFDEPRGIYEGL
jgi:hypothetical protein